MLHFSSLRLAASAAVARHAASAARASATHQRRSAAMHAIAAAPTTAAPAATTTTPSLATRIQETVVRAALAAFPSAAGATADAAARHSVHELCAVAPVRDGSGIASDYQTTAAFKLGPLVKLGPSVVASALVDALQQQQLQQSSSSKNDNKRDDDASRIAPFITASSLGGFVNFTVADRAIFDGVQAIASEEASLREQAQSHGAAAQQQQRVLVDFASPNMGKELHLGHMRSIVLGDAIARIAAYCGRTVTRVSHEGDFGTPVGMLLAQLLDRISRPAVLPQSPAELSRHYALAKERFDADAAFAERVHAVTLQLQNVLTQPTRSDDREANAIADLYEHVCDVSRAGIAEVLGHLDVTLTARPESSYASLIPELVNRLKQANALTELEGGAFGIYTPGFEAPLLVRKANGGSLYATVDLAAVLQRTREGHDTVIYVTDASQYQHFQQVFAAAFQSGLFAGAPRQPALKHVTFGLVRGADATKLASRAGPQASLLSVIQQAASHAELTLKGLADEGVPREQISRAAHSLGVAALKFFDLSHPKDYTFDLDTMLAHRGRTAVYVMYAIARLRSVRRHAKVDPLEFRRHRLHVDKLTDLERALALHVLRFPEVVHKADAAHAPVMICDYLLQTAAKMHSLYGQQRILDADAALESRLRLCFATERVLSEGMTILGIPIVDEM